ncbi:MAG: NADH:flavin oxidoreductase [Rhodobacter sp.]|nr:NADH:flavin oxidoreductase [Rhodobacter sp.]
MLDHTTTASTTQSHTHEDNAALIFEPLNFRHLQVKNRIFRSNLSGMFDDYNGQGGNARVNWETKFAKGGAGCIISSYTPVTVRGRILTRYAMIDNDDKIPFWRKIGQSVHEHDCKFMMQLSHSGRQQDLGGVENVFKKADSSTNRKDYFHGILCRAMSKPEIGDMVNLFAQGARRAREAGLDGVELHGANGYLITQFLSSGINDRKDEYGGGWENRARFVLEIIRAIRAEVGHDFHLQMKINAVDHNSWLYPWQHNGNTLEETQKICRLLMDNGKGVDAFHVSAGSTFPHPMNPPGDLPMRDLVRWYDGMISQGVRAGFNYRIFSNPIGAFLFRRYWLWRRGKKVEGINEDFAAAISRTVRELDPSVKVLVTGGWQHADRIAGAIRSGACDGVSIGRPLIANNNLPQILRHANGPEKGKECTYCNKCLINDIENPLGCYELSRFDGDTWDEKYDAMIKEVMSVYYPPTFT